MKNLSLKTVTRDGTIGKQVEHSPKWKTSKARSAILAAFSDHRLLPSSIQEEFFLFFSPHPPTPNVSVFFSSPCLLLSTALSTLPHSLSTPFFFSPFQLPFPFRTYPSTLLAGCSHIVFTGSVLHHDYMARGMRDQHIAGFVFFYSNCRQN